MLPVSGCAGDRDVLIEFWRATEGPNWYGDGRKENWLSDRPLNEWKNVETDVDGCVIRLFLWDYNLGGELPASLGRLSKLEYLLLANSPLLGGGIPEELGNLSNLKRLMLYNNDLGGEIPESLGRLSNLERLSLHENKLEGRIPEQLRNLRKLEVLHLGHNLLSGEIPAWLEELANLRVLYLDNFQRDYPEGGHPHDNQFSGPIPPELGSLVNLEVLYLSNLRLSGTIPSELGRLVNLNRWRIGGNEELGGCVPAVWELEDDRRTDFDEAGLPYCTE